VCTWSGLTAVQKMALGNVWIFTLLCTTASRVDICCSSGGSIGEKRTHILKNISVEDYQKEEMPTKLVEDPLGKFGILILWEQITIDSIWHYFILLYRSTEYQKI